MIRERRKDAWRSGVAHLDVAKKESHYFFLFGGQRVGHAHKESIHADEDSP